MVLVKSGGYQAGDFAVIDINTKPVYLNRNSNSNYRGLHIVILDINTGKTLYAQVFDTYTTSEYIDKFIKFDFPEGSVVVAACKDECAKNLSNDARQWFANMGSKEILELTFRQSFAFIGKIGSKVCQEDRATLASYGVKIT